MRFIATMPDKSVDFTFTDIPYNMVNHASNGLRSLDKGKANILTFELDVFLLQILRVTGSSPLIFCAKGAIQSDLFPAFCAKWHSQGHCVGKAIHLQMNGQHVYLSGVELAVWFKYRGVEKLLMPIAKILFSVIPMVAVKSIPTEKNHELLKDLILDKH